MKTKTYTFEYSSVCHYEVKLHADSKEQAWALVEEDPDSVEWDEIGWDKSETELAAVALASSDAVCDDCGQALGPFWHCDCGCFCRGECG